MNRHLSLVALVLLALLPAACGGGGSAVQEAEKRWAAAEVEDYRLQIREFRSVWCLYTADVEVRAGQVVSATVTATPGPARDCSDYTGGVLDRPVPTAPEEVPAYWTVPGMFELARRWEEEQDDEEIRVELEFDPELGYPRRLSHDNEIAIDDDWSLTVIELVRE